MNAGRSDLNGVSELADDRLNNTNSSAAATLRRSAPGISFNPLAGDHRDGPRGPALDGAGGDDFCERHAVLVRVGFCLPRIPLERAQPPSLALQDSRDASLADAVPIADLGDGDAQQERAQARWEKRWDSPTVT
jgi:hypothetical protein